MTKKISVLLAVVMTAVVLVGCGKGKASSDVIEIEGYKNLKISSSSEEKEEDAIWEALAEQCKVKEFPEEELTALISELETQYSYTGYYEGKTGAEKIEEIHGITSEELAKQQLTKKYAVRAIAKKEKLELAPEEYQEILEEKAKANGLADGASYESMFGKETLEQRFLEERVLAFLMEHAK